MNLTARWSILSGVKQGRYQCDRLRPRLESQDVWGVDFGYYFELVVQPKRGKQCMTFGLVYQVVIWTDFGLRVPTGMVSPFCSGPVLFTS